MIIKTFKKGTIKLYDGIKELPIVRHNDLNKLMIQESGIGNSMDDIFRHFANLSEHLDREQINLAKIELDNIRYNCFTALNKISFKTRLLLGYCYLINDHIVGDTDDDVEVNFCLKLLDDIEISEGEIVEILDDLKKK